MVIAATKELFWLVLAWVALAVGLFAAVWVLTLAITGAAPPMCRGEPALFGLGLNVGLALTVGLVGATVLVGGYWALGARRWPVRIVLLGLVAVAAVFLLGLGGGLVVCRGGAGG